MPPTTPSTAGPAASAQSRLRARRLSVGTHPDVSRRDGVLSGLEDHSSSINDAQRQGYASGKSSSGNPRKSAPAEEPLLAGDQDGAGSRGPRMDNSQSRHFEQSNHPRANSREARAAALLPGTTNGARAGAGADFSAASRAKTKRGNHAEPMPTRRQKELRGLAELVQAELERAADAQAFEHLKQETNRAFQEMAVLRAELGRAEAAVEGGKKQRDTEIAALEHKLSLCQQELCRLETEGESHRLQHAKGAEEEVKLREELKRTQEALSFLSAWEEEKIELDAEVASLKEKLAAAIGEGNQRLEDAQHEFSVATAVQGYKARSRFEIDTDKARLELERGLSDEFRNHRRENDVLRRQRDHHDGETIRMIKSVARLEAERFATRAELEDERRMHHTTIRRKKRADTVIAELQAQLNISLLPSRPCGTPRISHYPTNALRARVAPTKGPWNSRPLPRPSPPTGRAKLLCRDLEEACTPSRGRGGGSRATKEWVESKVKGSEDISVGSGGVLPGREAERADDVSEAGDRTDRVSPRVSSLLVPARPSDGRSGGDLANAGSYAAADALTALDDGTAAADGFQPSAGGRKRRRNSGKGVVSGNTSSLGDDSASVGRWSSTDGGGGDREKDRGGEADNIREPLPTGGSDVSSADVWSMLDNYVHRRAEVAKANRHVRAIEAMRRHLAKTATRIVDATGVDNGEPAKHDDRGRSREHRNGRSSNSDECVWRASRKMWVGRRSRTSEVVYNGRGAEPVKMALYAKERRRSPGGATRIESKAAPLEQTEPRNNHFQPHPPRHARIAPPGVGCMSNLSQTTAVSASKSGGEGTAQLTHKIEQPSTTHSDRFLQGTNAQHYHHGQKSIVAGGGRAPKGLHHNETLAPSDGLPSANRHRGLRPHDGDDCNHFGYTDDDAHESPITSVTIRPPSSTSPAASTTRVGVVRGAAVPLQMAGRLWGKDVDGGVLTGVGGHGGGVESGRPAHRGKGAKAVGRWNQLGGLCRKRRTCRDMELADWIEANTNLVNVSPW